VEGAAPRAEPSPVRPPHVVVVGAGVAGLGTALALGRTGHRVTLVEGDDTPLPDSVEAAFAWDRRGAPQVRHSHGFAARLHAVLRERFPDVLDDLRAAGVVEHDLGAMIPAETGLDVGGLTVLAARRTTYEWVLRRAVLRAAHIRLLVGVRVRALAVTAGDDGAPPRVAGVVLDDGADIAADAVIAATGPRSDLRQWLAPHGVDVPEVVAPTGVVYLSRFYRLLPGRALPGGIVLSASRRAGLSYSCIAADNGTYSITIAVDSDDGELRRHLLDPARFEAVCRLLPGIDHLVAPDLAAPITGVHAMGGLINRLRRFVDAGGRPAVAGLHAVGDAHTTTNPVYGRGCSLAMVQAAVLSDAFADHPGDPLARARAYEEASVREIEPWYHFAVDGDALRAGTGGDGTGVDAQDPRFTLQDLMRVGAAEPSLLPTTLRVLTLLDTPGAVAGDPRFRAALGAVRRARADKAAARAAAGYRPPVRRDDLLGAGT
jgi:2-polyprenyl-6-methoxyphenol hydroxylase-like FAD-dependent oxidoreductase